MTRERGSELAEYQPAVNGVHARHGTLLVPHAEPTRVFTGFRGLPRWLGERKMGRGEATSLVHNPRAHAPRRRGLEVMSFNVFHSAVRRKAFLEYFELLEAEDRIPDVLALQETNQPLTLLLARRHGYHFGYFGRELQGSIRFLNGKCVLSRHPIVEAVHFTFAVDEQERYLAIHHREDIFKLGPGELNEDRGAMRVTLDVGHTLVDVYSVHLTLGDAIINADQLRQLTGLVRTRPNLGAAVLGDFNANLNLLLERGKAKPGERTGSVETYHERYGRLPTGTMDAAGDEGVRRALRALDAAAPDVFERAPTHVLLPGHRKVTPLEARKALLGGADQLDTDTVWRLMDIADGATLALDPLPDGTRPATGKRFDSVFATAQLKPLDVELDRTTGSSDHTPVRVRFAL